MPRVEKYILIFTYDEEDLSHYVPEIGDYFLGQNDIGVTRDLKKAKLYMTEIGAIKAKDNYNKCREKNYCRVQPVKIEF